MVLSINFGALLIMSAVSSASPAFQVMQQYFQQNEIDAGQQEAMKGKGTEPSYSISRSYGGATDENDRYFPVGDGKEKITY
jgi:hypothetical protein